MNGLDAHTSQFYEWLPWTSQALASVPAEKDKRKAWLANTWKRQISPSVKESLTRWYGPAHAGNIKHAESFEICEYGQQPTNEDIVRLFPMLQRPRTLSAPHIASKIKLDGRLSEDMYTELPEYTMWNGLTGQAVLDSQYQTTFYIFRDDESLYISFISRDPDIYSTFTERDQHLWEEEVVEVFIDTDDNPSTYFELEISPASVLFDSYIVDPQNIDLVETPKFNFKDIQFKVFVDGTLNKRNDKDHFWSVEMAIPIKELIEPGSSSHDSSKPWRINFYRINTDKSPIKYQSFRPTFGRFHKPAYFAELIMK